MAKTKRAAKTAVLALEAPKYVSYSRLKLFDECSMKFKHVYEDGTLKGFSDNIYTRIGNFCHEGIETFYRQYLDDSLPRVESPYVAMTEVDGTWDKELAKYNLLALKPKLLNYAHHTTALYHRASAAYKGKDAIRKADGGVASSPSMTNGWKDYAKLHGLNDQARFIDQTAAKAAPERWGDIPLSQAYAESLGIMYPYQHPPQIHAVVAVELPVSEIMFQSADAAGNLLLDEAGEPILSSRRRGPHPLYIDPETGKEVFVEVVNPFWIPKLDASGKLIPDGNGDYERRDDLLFNAYIDLLTRDEPGNLEVCDHKTNAEKPTVFKVSRHEQLLVYGLIIYLLTGEMPKWVAMNHLRSNSYIRAEFSLAAAEAAMERLLSIVHATEVKAFVKQDVDGYHSVCQSKGRKDTDPPILCAGLSICHPDVFQQYLQAGMVKAVAA